MATAPPSQPPKNPPPPSKPIPEKTPQQKNIERALEKVKAVNEGVTGYSHGTSSGAKGSVYQGTGGTEIVVDKGSGKSSIVSASPQQQTKPIDVQAEKTQRLQETLQHIEQVSGTNRQVGVAYNPTRPLGYDIVNAPASAQINTTMLSGFNPREPATQKIPLGQIQSPLASEIRKIPVQTALSSSQARALLGTATPEGAYNYYASLGLGQGNPESYAKFKPGVLDKATAFLYGTTQKYIPQKLSSKIQAIGQTDYQNKIFGLTEKIGKQILEPFNIVGQKTNNKLLQDIYKIPEITRQIIPQSYNYAAGFVGGLREQPGKTLLTTTAFIALPPLLSGAEYGLVAAAPYTAGLTGYVAGGASVIAPWVNRALLTGYVASAGYRTITSSTPAYTLGEITSTEALPMVSGLYLGSKIAFPITYKTSFEKGLQNLPHEYREAFKELRGQQSRIKAGTISPTSFDLSQVESGTPRAREITRDFLVANKADIVVGGSIAQKFQLQVISGLRPSGDIDVYGKNLAAELANKLTSAGELARAEGNKVYVTGLSGESSKFIEFNPMSKLRMNIATVSNPFVPFKFKLVTTPEGIKIPKLQYQAARKLYGGFEIETDIYGKVTTPRYSKDIPDYQALVLASPEKISRPSFLDTANKMFASKIGRFSLGLNTQLPSTLIGGRTSAIDFAGGKGDFSYPKYSYPSYPTLTYPSFALVSYPSILSPSYPIITSPSYSKFAAASYPNFSAPSYSFITPASYPTIPTLSYPSITPFSYPSITQSTYPAITPASYTSITPSTYPAFFASAYPKPPRQYLFNFGVGKIKKKKVSKRKPKRQKYLPSFGALEKEVYGKPAKSYTGTELFRPIPGKKPKNPYLKYKIKRGF